MCNNTYMDILYVSDSNMTIKAMRATKEQITVARLRHKDLAKSFKTFRTIRIVTIEEGDTINKARKRELLRWRKNNVKRTGPVLLPPEGETTLAMIRMAIDALGIIQGMVNGSR